MRPVLVALAALALSCAAARSSPSEAAPTSADLTVLRAAELARVRCLVVAPFENASDAPLAAEAATGAVLAGVDPARAKVFPIPELRALFRDTPLELPEGFSPSLALELAELLGADAALYGAVEGRGQYASGELLVTMRLMLTAHRDLVFASSTPVRPQPGERPEAAVRRTVVEVAQPLLERLGDQGRKRCFDPDRTKALRTVALREGRTPASPAASGRTAGASTPPNPASNTPTTPAAPAPAQPRTARQVEWAKRLAGAGRIVAEEVAFAGRTAELQRDGGLADLAMVLAAAPEVKVRLEAFVDATSDHEGDARLSAAMAQTAVQRLVDLGIGRDRLSWAGRGGESPLLPNFTVRGRSANRRVEVVGIR